MNTFLFLCLLSSVLAKVITFSNTQPRLDTTGKIIDAHDGTIQQFQKGGLYYIHAMEYGLCKEPTLYGCDQTQDHCGFREDHNITIFSSPDMSSGSWKWEGYALDWHDRPGGIVFRSHVVYNPNTNEYVLWWNYVPTAPGQLSSYAAATSSSPTAPFKLRNGNVNVTRAVPGAGDFDIFVDYSHKPADAYIVYSAQYWMSIEKLTDDFLYSTGKNASCGPNNSPLFPEYFVEAPVFFKRNNIFYVLFGHCCCFCEQGSGVIVHTASSPLGPWTAHPNDLACRPPTNVNLTHHENLKFQAIPTPGQGCLYQSNEISVTRSQQNYIVQIPTTTGTTYVWTGDRWQQAPDGIKGHEPQFWVPLIFNTDGSIEPISWVDEFQLDVL